MALAQGLTSWLFVFPLLSHMPRTHQPSAMVWNVAIFACEFTFFLRVPRFRSTSERFLHPSARSQSDHVFKTKIQRFIKNSTSVMGIYNICSIWPWVLSIEMISTFCAKCTETIAKPIGFHTISILHSLKRRVRNATKTERKHWVL